MNPTRGPSLKNHTSMTTSVRVRYGERSVTDGLFAETGEREAHAATLQVGIAEGESRRFGRLAEYLRAMV